MTVESIKRFLFGAPLDPFKQDTRKHIALIAFFAWVGLGADGISSSAYGPEEAFVALQGHTELAIFLAFATGITVFILATAYLQVIELFPNGGGGYKVASTLLGPKAGLVSGSALVIDYVLTIGISVASGTDALFSIFPANMQPYKILVEIFLVIVLGYLNLRGMRESIKILMPIFLGFIATHVVVILYGILGHASGLSELIPDAVEETQEMAGTMGWFAVLALFFKAFSMGGGTYTGLESISNSVHNLAEPRVRTGKVTMMVVAASLAFMATGIILLYLLWDVDRVHGQTLNATAFTKMTSDWSIGGTNVSALTVGVLMMFEAGLLFVAANTGFLAGPTVLANMAVDRWMPSLFSALSSRLVTKNGILLMGAAAIGALLVTGGRVDMLVVLYSINVFLTFTLSLLGLCRYRWARRSQPKQLLHLIMPFLALIVCSSILIMTLFEKFFVGGWMTVIITSLLIGLGYIIKRHYTYVRRQLEKTEEELSAAFSCNTKVSEPPKLDYTKPTAVFLVNETNASGLHTFLWVQRLFPKMFENFVFVSVGEYDTEEYVDSQKWDQLRRDTKQMLKRYEAYCHCKGLAATYYYGFGTDTVQKLTELTDKITEEFPKAVFFTSKISTDNENVMTQLLHNQTAYILQRRLHNKGKTLIIMPMKL